MTRRQTPWLAVSEAALAVLSVAAAVMSCAVHFHLVQGLNGGGAMLAVGAAPAATLTGPTVRQRKKTTRFLNLVTERYEALRVTPSRQDIT